MPKEKRKLIEELTWTEVRKTVADTCKELSNIIDEISPSKEFTVFKVLYPFGTKIIDKNSFHLPIGPDGEYSNIKNKLGYNTVPLGIIIDNNVEVFFDIHRKIFSLAVFENDLEIGIWEHFGWSNNYSITAGARSLYMLPKISEALSHKQLKRKFGITESPPKHLYDHWQVFAQLAQSNSFPTEWFCEIIFLSNKWINAIKNDPAWSKLALYISHKGWQHSSYARKKAALDMVWEIFMKSLSNKELKFDPYVVDTLKHIIYVSTGTIPANTPFAGSEKTGPLKNIQMIYEDSRGYGLEEYTATIMHPKYFSITEPEPVYYSLQLPTLLESLPRAKKITSVIDNIRELSELLNCFLNKDTEPWSTLMIGDSLLGDTIKNLQVDYFHGDMFAYGDLIKSSLKMPELDPRLRYSASNDKKRIFASNSSFLKGCVRISTKLPPPDTGTAKSPPNL